MSGTCTRASTQLSNSDTASTMNRSRTYTPAVSGERKMGKNARMAISVAPSRGIAVCRPMAVRASMRGRPLRMPTSMPSIITMALSTSIPIARIRAPSDTRCMVPSSPARKVSEPSTISTRLMPMMMPLRMPMNIMSTTITMATDSMRLSTNVPSDAPTRSGWKNTLWHSTPVGNRVSRRWSIHFSTLSPTLSMSVPDEAAMSMPRAFSPS